MASSLTPGALLPVGEMHGRDLFCARSDIIMEQAAMNRMNSRKIALLAIAGIGLLFATRGVLARISAGVPGARVQDANTPVIRFVKNPELAPPLQVQDILGKPVNKDNWGGKVVLVNFWATWCPPCREEIPELLELKKEFKDRLEIVGISEDDDPPEYVLKFARQKGMTYPIVMATQALIESYGGVPALPTTFLVDTQGRVVQKHSGLHPIEGYELEISFAPGDARGCARGDIRRYRQVFLKNAANATELPGVSFKGLTAEQKKRALRRLNSDSCTCGCKLTVSQCRVNDTECPVSGKIAADVRERNCQRFKAAPQSVREGTELDHAVSRTGFNPSGFEFCGARYDL